MFRTLSRNRAISLARGDLPMACVIGDISMVRALGRRGIPVAVATHEAQASLLHSRYCQETLTTPSPVDDPDGLVAHLISWARTQPSAPVLFYQGDHDLLALSRHRDAISTHARVLLPPAELVEDCVDKVRFQALAERLALPVPTTRVLPRGSGCRRVVTAWSEFPCVLKPAMRTRWFSSGLLQRAGLGGQKALLIRDRAQLESLESMIDAHETDLLLQALVPGGEHRIVSYHGYVRPGGGLVSDFTGRKIRTAPRQHGVSTYVEITDDPELKRLGRDLVERLGFSGVVKMDFKIHEQTGQLCLLEINPRFNLWHHPATIAGVALPELVYRDCIEPGSARQIGRVRSGVRWFSARADRSAQREGARSDNVSRARWLWQFATAAVNEDFCLTDPMPALTDLWRTVRRRLRRALPAPIPRTAAS